MDGDIGRVKDFYFDDKLWVIRYLVVDTTSWLAGRPVLLSPHGLGKWAHDEKTLQVKMLRKRIQNAPSADLDKPLSRQDEIEYYGYYGWPVYWEGSATWGLGDYPVMLPPLVTGTEAGMENRHSQNQPLQSAVAATGYSLQAVDGTIGQVSGFMVDDESWEIRELVVETGNWFSGQDILISTSKIERISYEQSKVFLTLTKADVQRAAESSLAKAGA